jgi:hypothetical protein
VCTVELKERLNEFIPLLKKLSAADKKERATIILKAPTCFIRFLCECGLNVLKGNLKLSDDQYQKLRPHRRLLLFLSTPSLSFKVRRRAFLRKKGGFLPVVAPVLLSALSGFVGQAAAKVFGLA